MVKNTFGGKITPILIELEAAFLENKSVIDKGLTGNPNYSDDALAASLTIFMGVMVDKLYTRRKGNISESLLLKKVEDLGKELRGFVKFYTGVDTVKLYEDGKNEDG